MVYIFRFAIGVALMGLSVLADSRGSEAAFWPLLSAALVLLALSLPPKGTDAK